MNTGPARSRGGPSPVPAVADMLEKVLPAGWWLTVDEAAEYVMAADPDGVSVVVDAADLAWVITTPTGSTTLVSALRTLRRRSRVITRDNVTEHLLLPRKADR